MKTRTIFVLLALPLLTLPACRRDHKTPVEEEKKRAAARATRDIPLMPVQIGDQWTYHVAIEVPAGGGPAANEHDRVRTYLGKIVPHEGMDATECFEVTAPGTAPEREFVEILPDKILLRGAARVTEKPGRPLWYEPPVLFIQAGAEAGSKGRDLKSENGALSRQIQVIAREEVTVPAGTFPAIRLLMIGTDGPLELRRTIWFAPGQGIVREEKTRYQGDKLLYRETQELTAIRRAAKK